MIKAVKDLKVFIILFLKVFIAETVFIFYTFHPLQVEKNKQLRL